ncbi:unnamed protein product [Brassicogethes aeneus]|uniref:MADF domain-containing protein n=1 Tax=Brassicogethes aeneus TaxID=1431903 RepID=A0A9P0BFE1_BRAAE|nr:unnamed protein product [Brassicogethes aeneus]
MNLRTKIILENAKKLSGAVESLNSEQENRSNMLSTSASYAFESTASQPLALMPIKSTSILVSPGPDSCPITEHACTGKVPVASDAGTTLSDTPSFPSNSAVGLIDYLDIKLYKSFPCLWKVKSQEYSDRNAKSQAYDILIEKMQTVHPEANRDTVVKKINSLRTTYRKELKRVLDSERSGAGEEDIYVPHLWYYELMNFIRDQEIPRNTKLNIENTKINEDPTSPATETIPFESESTDISLPPTPCSTLSIPSHQKIGAMTNVTKYNFDDIGKVWASKLRDLPAQQAIHAEKIINEVFYEAQMQNLNRNCFLQIQQETSTTIPLTRHAHSYSIPTTSNIYPSFNSQPPFNPQPRPPFNPQPQPPFNTKHTFKNQSTFNTYNYQEEPERETAAEFFHHFDDSRKNQRRNFKDDIPRSSTSQKLNIMTPQLTSALDRTNVSARDATIILAASAESFGIPLENVNLCPSTVYRHRIKNRKSLGDSLKNNFKAPNTLTLHWDGKLLPEMTGSTKVERLPVIITGLDCEQLLGVPKLNESTGLHQSEVIFELLQEWDITNKIGALCFDTTSVNTGFGLCAVGFQENWSEEEVYKHLAELFKDKLEGRNFEISIPISRSLVKPNLATSSCRDGSCLSIYVR